MSKDVPHTGQMNQRESRQGYWKAIKDYSTPFAATPSKDQIFDRKGYI